MFGWSIVRTKELEEMEWRERRLNVIHRWFAGWQDLDVIWDWIREPNGRAVEWVRTDYAQARNTDVYGKPTPKPETP